MFGPLTESNARPMAPSEGRRRPWREGATQTLTLTTMTLMIQKVCLGLGGQNIKFILFDEIAVPRNHDALLLDPDNSEDGFIAPTVIAPPGITPGVIAPPAEAPAVITHPGMAPALMEPPFLAPADIEPPVVAPTVIEQGVITPAVTRPLAIAQPDIPVMEPQTMQPQFITDASVVLPDQIGTLTMPKEKTPSNVLPSGSKDASQVVTNQPGTSSSPMFLQPSSQTSSRTFSKVKASSKTSSNRGFQKPTQSSTQPSKSGLAHQTSSQQAGLLGFLVGNDDGHESDTTDEVFDPEQIDDYDDEVESDSDEGQSAFRRKALSATSGPRGPMVKTRSQSRSQNVELVGKIVFAHKGKVVPCWFPGKVVSKTERGFEILFFGKFGTQVCTEKNILTREDYLLKKNDSSLLFKVPSKYKSSFEEAMKTMNEAVN